MNGTPRSSSAAREQIKPALDRLFQMLKNDSRPIIPTHSLPNLGINVRLFDPDIPGDCGRYFTPWTTEQMANHEKNPEVNDESTGLQALGSPLDEGILSCPQETYTWSSQMSERLKWEVESAPRYGTRGNDIAFQQRIFRTNL
ncbi:uncharacterized protein LDX57_000842 [Aspergillus melleus]|uniref:uncharacterized protein n=1 Tax=Aspergillus melleus TaxID=138277 RepID=UPI001E8C9E13|nr:uncharacterized protein LDX57_000842 [Aspergillus melleus]KAH8423086.1 hypothetical protein LDX57_000842 [Aspergillus melleus]